MNRQILNISMPPNLARWVRAQSERGEFASVSDYIRSLVRLDQSRRRIAAAERREDELRRLRASIPYSQRRLTGVK